MNLNQQVTSLELSKKLKELGVKQEQSLFAWCMYSPDSSGNNERMELFYTEKAYEIKGVSDLATTYYYDAFTVAELGEMLPPFYRSMNVGRLNGGKSWWEVKYWQETDIKKEFCADTEADARAKMLIYLLENKLITI